MKSHKVKEKFIELRAQGLSYAKISKALGVSKPTLIEWSKRFASEIKKLEACELDALYKKFCMYKQHRIQLFSEQLLKIREELTHRDLSEIPTPNLLHLFLEFCDALRAEIDLQEGQDSSPVDTKNIIQQWNRIMDRYEFIS
jgi:transcriptional regulator with XRE-family HTH domain